MRVAAIAAGAIFLLAVAAFGNLAPGYSQTLHPVALLGAAGMPHAALFNTTAFVLPGLLAAWVMVRLRTLSAQLPLAARLGSAMLLLAAAAFLMQGVLPLQPETIDSASSGPHAAAWTFWWLAYGAGAVSLALGARGGPVAGHGRLLLACAAGSILFAIVLPGAVVAGISQRIAFAGWFAGVYVAASAVAKLHAQDHRGQPERDQVGNDHRP